LSLSLRKIINPPLPLSVLLTVLCAALWSVEGEAVPQQGTAPLTLWLQENLPQGWLTILLALTISMCNGLLLWLLNNSFTLIRERSFLLFFCCVFLLSCWDSVHYNIAGHLAAGSVIVSFFIFLSMYHRRDATEAAFLGSFIISLAALLLIEPLVLLLLPVWIGFAMMRALSLRSFLASVVGLAAAVIPLCFVKIVNIHDFIKVLTSFFWKDYDISSLSPSELLYFVTLVILGITALVGIYSTSLRDVVRTRINLNYIIVFLVFTFVIALLYFPVYSLLLPLIAMLYAVVFSQPVSLRDSNFFFVLFMIFCAVNLLYRLQNVLTAVV